MSLMTLNRLSAKAPRPISQFSCEQVMLACDDEKNTIRSLGLREDITMNEGVGRRCDYIYTQCVEGKPLIG